MVRCRVLAVLLILCLAPTSLLAATIVQSRETVQDGDVGGVVSLAYTSNVTSGNLLLVKCSRASFATADLPTTADLTKTAGTATIGTIALVTIQNTSDSFNNFSASIYSVPVTGTGSLTLQVAGNASDFFYLVIEEWPSTVNGTSEASNSGTGSSTTPSSGNATSAGNALFAGFLATYTSGNDAITPDSPWSTVQEEEDGSLHAVGNASAYTASGGTTDAFSAVIATSVRWAAVTAVFAESGGGGSNVSSFFRRSVQP